MDLIWLKFSGMIGTLQRGVTMGHLGSRIVFTLALAATLAGTLVALARADGSDSMARSRTFVVQALLPNGKADIGTGVIVDRRGDILTIASAAHVVGSSSALRILDTSRRAYYEVVDVRLVPKYDLAFVRVRAQKNSPPDAALFGKAAPGEAVWIWGNPEQAFWELATGTVQNASASLPDDAGVPRITIACERCSHGDSGSGVFNAAGRLGGILTAGWQKPGGPIEFFEVQPIAIVEQELKIERDVASP